MTRNHRLAGPRRGRWLGLPLLSTIALFAVAGPAAAAGAVEGSGAGVGYSTIDVAGGPPAAPLCLGASGGSYVIDVAAGSVTAAGTDGAAEYAGTLTVTIDITAPFEFSPVGVFADNSGCVGPPAAVPADIAVTGSGPAGSVSCTDSGTFSRVNTTITFNEVLETVGALDGTCTVTSAVTGAVTVGSVVHEFVGNEYPCLEEPFTTIYTCPGPLADAHVQGEWTAAGAG